MGVARRFLYLYFREKRVIMKRSVIGIIGGVSALVLGLLIALGPQFIFKLCGVHDDGGFSQCHWSGQAEIGAGAIIAALGICLLIFTDLKTHLGLLIGIFLMGIIALFIPNGLIGGCGSPEMACRKVAFPVLTVLSAVLLAGAIINLIYIDRKAKA